MKYTKYIGVILLLGVWLMLLSACTSVAAVRFELEFEDGLPQSSEWGTFRGVVSVYSGWRVFPGIAAHKEEFQLPKMALELPEGQFWIYTDFPSVVFPVNITSRTPADGGDGVVHTFDHSYRLGEWPLLSGNFVRAQTSKLSCVADDGLPVDFRLYSVPCRTSVLVLDDIKIEFDGSYTIAIESPIGFHRWNPSFGALDRFDFEHAVDYIHISRSALCNPRSESLGEAVYEHDFEMSGCAFGIGLQSHNGKRFLLLGTYYGKYMERSLRLGLVPIGRDENPIHILHGSHEMIEERLSSYKGRIEGFGVRFRGCIE